MERCPQCDEFKHVSMAVSPPSDRKPRPVWKFQCKVCHHSWSKDENEPAVLKS